jgi:hypothetical protein
MNEAMVSEKSENIETCRAIVQLTIGEGIE